ncbi:hypothetical protein E2C01_101724 [Portunus trituberculatus]|uniref:Uncharacterized protein n=1 Tax=Portunus trituberculatus TaxID=210409 RepID=A0A5B7KL25_PORTR|nr:hypothetical protein [Portunus trituberculatus]
MDQPSWEGRVRLSRGAMGTDPVVVNFPSNTSSFFIHYLTITPNHPPSLALHHLTTSLSFPHSLALLIFFPLSIHLPLPPPPKALFLSSFTGGVT